MSIAAGALGLIRRALVRLRGLVVVLFLLGLRTPLAYGQNTPTNPIPWLNNIQVNNFWSEGSSIIASDTENGTSNTSWYNLDNWGDLNVNLPGATDNQVVIAGHASPEIDGGTAGALTLQLWIYTLVGTYKVDGEIVQGDYLPGVPVTGFGTGVNTVLTVDGGGILNTQSIVTGFISENLEYDTFNQTTTITNGPAYTGQNFGGFVVTGAVSTVNVGDPLQQNGNLTLGPGSAVNVDDGGTLYVNGMASIDSYSPSVTSFILVSGAGSQADFSQLTMGAEGNGAGLGVSNGGVVQAAAIFLQSGLITADGAGSQVNITDFQIGWQNANTGVVSTGTIEISNGAVVSAGLLDMFSGNISITGSPGDQGVLVTSEFYNHQYFDDQSNLIYGSVALFFDGGILRISANASDNPQIYLNPGGAFIDTNGYNLTLSPLNGDEYVSGTGGLTKQGQGTLTLDLPANYTGTTTVSGGTLKFGSHNSIGGSVSGDIVDNANVDFAYSQVYTGYISGNGTVQVDAALTLLGLNTFSGGLILDHGGSLTLATSDASVLGVGGLTFNGGTFQFDTGVTTDISPNGLTFSSNGGTIDTNGNNVTFASALNGTGSLTKAGAGTLTLEGNVAISALTVMNGTLTMGASNLLTNTPSLTLNGGDFSLGAFDQAFSNLTLLSGNFNGTGNLTFNNGGTITLDGGAVSANLLGGAALVVNSSATVTLSGNNTFNGTTTISSGTLMLGNTHALGNSTLNYTIGGGVLSFGSLTNATFGGLTGNQNLSIGGVTLTVGGNNGNGTYGGVLSGAGELVKLGTGTLTLNASNTFTGATIISGGTLQLGDGTKNGAVAGFVEIVGNLVIDTNAAGQTFSNTIIGAGGLIVDGAGTLFIDGDGSGYSGSTTINTGTLLLGAFDVLGTASPLIVNTGGALDLGGLSATVGSVTINGTIQNGTLTGASYTGQSGTVSAVLAGAGGLNLAVAGTLTLDNANTYTGNTTISSGTLVLGNANALQNSTLNITGGALSFGSLESATLGGLSGAQNISMAGLALNVGGDGANTTYSGILSGSGMLTKNGAGALTLGGADTYTGGTTLDAGTLSLGSASALGTGSLAFNGGTLQFGTGISTDVSTLGITLDSAGGSFDTNGNSVTFTSVIAGVGALTKIGLGTLTLNAANTFTGNTIVSGGTLTLANVNALQNSTLDDNTGGGTLSFGGLTTANLGGLSGSQNLSIAGVTLNVGGNGADTTYSGGISGSGGVLTAFVKNGAGTLTLTGNSTYSGLTNINTGTLVISGSGAALSGGTVVTSNSNLLVANGGLVEASRITGSGSVTFNGGTLLAVADNPLFINTGLGAFIIGSGGATIDTGGVFGSGGFTLGVFSPLSGSGGLTVVGYGTLDLKVASTYSGDLLIGSDNYGSSILEIDDPDALQNSTLDFGENGNPGTFSIVSPTTAVLGGLAGDGQLTLINTQSNQAVALTVGSNNANTYFDGYITGNGSLTKVGNGTLELGVDADSDYSGGTTINSGTLKVDVFDALGTGGLTMNGGTLQLGVNFDFSSQGINFAANGGTIDTNGNSLTFASALTGTGAFTKGGAGTLALGGTVASLSVFVTGGALALGTSNRLISTANLTLNGGDFTLGSFNQTLGNFTLASGNLNGTGNLTVNSSGLFVLQSGNVYANLAGSGALDKTGSGTVSLSGNDTYTGNTTVSGGTLLLSSNTALGPGVLSLNGGALAFAPGVSTALPGASLNLAANSGAINIGNSSLTFAANITGNGGLNIIGNGTLTLTGNNTYAGNTTITNGTLLLSGNSALPVNSTVVVDANSTFNLNGQNTTINALSGNGNVTLGAGGNLTVSGNTVTTFTGNISGTGNLTVTGNDSLILAGNNTYTGNTTILGGTLQIGNGTNNGFVPGNITDNGTLVISGNGASQTFSGAIVGTGNLVVSGNGTVILAGNNTFTGNTTIESGTLDISNTTALGNSTTPIMLGSNTSGTLEFTGDSGDLTQNISVTGSGGGTVSNNGTGTLTLSGNLMKNGTVLTFTGGNIKVTGVVSGFEDNSDVDVDGADVTLTNQNTYNGPTYIYDNGSVHNGILNALPVGTTLVLGESTDNTGGTYDLNGFNQTVAGLNSAGSGTNVVTNNGASGANTLTIAGSSSSSFGGVIEDGSSAQTSVTVSEGGSGVSVALGGANTYTGPTLVVSGQLQINGSLAASTAVTVESGATLSGNGTIGGNVTMNTGAMLAPGNGTGTLTVGNLTLGGSTDGSATLKFVLSNTDNASSLLNITGTLAKGGGSDFIFDFEDTGYFNGVNIGNPNIYTLADFNTNSGFVVSDFGYTNLATGLRGNFILGANDLQFAVVPEPAAWGLFASGIAFLFAFHRRYGPTLLRRKNSWLERAKEL